MCMLITSDYLAVCCVSHFTDWTFPNRLLREMSEFVRAAKDAAAALQIPAPLSLTIILSFVVLGCCAIINLSSVRRELLQVKTAVTLLARRAAYCQSKQFCTNSSAHLQARNITGELRLDPAGNPGDPQSTKANAVDQDNPFGGRFPQDMSPSFGCTAPQEMCGMPRATRAWASAACFFNLRLQHGALRLKGPFEKTMGRSRTVVTPSVTRPSTARAHSLSRWSLKWKVPGQGARRAMPSRVPPPSSSQLHQRPQGEKERETIQIRSHRKFAGNCMASIITSLCCWVCFRIFIIIIIIPDSLVQYLILPGTSFLWFLLADWLKVAQTFHLLVFTSWLQKKKVLLERAEAVTVLFWFKNKCEQNYSWQLTNMKYTWLLGY